MNRRLTLIVLMASALSLLAACASISSSELKSIGAKITPASIDFATLHTYAQRAKTAYAGEKAIRAKYPAAVRIAAPAGSDVLYILESDEKAGTQYITVRGTVDRKNFSEDLDIAVRDDRKIDIPVHEGFDQVARAIYADVRPYLKPGYKTHLTGHSLGGAVAAILTIYLIEDGHAVERVVTFGQPRFTTAKGVERLGFLPITRVVDENDVVPMVPPALEAGKHGPYEHVGAEVILLEGPHYVYLDAHDANRIAIGEFWRSMSFADLPDHSIDKYLARIESKLTNAVEVPYNERERYAAQ
jgi:hypothetical protein